MARRPSRDEIERKFKRVVERAESIEAGEAAMNDVVGACEAVGVPWSMILGPYDNATAALDARFAVPKPTKVKASVAVEIESEGADLDEIGRLFAQLRADLAGTDWL